MSQQKTPAPAPPSLSAHDILYVLFKHKWKIIVYAMLGVVAAISFYLFSPPVYESQAKLLVRYIVDTSVVDNVESSRSSSGPTNENLMNSEVEILTSWDLTTEVAKAVGLNRLLKQTKASADVARAARSIQKGLTVNRGVGTNIITVSYRNRDPELAAVVLTELVTRYFTKHLEVHRSADAFNFVAQQSDAVRARLNQTEEELTRLKDMIGITSLAESVKGLNVGLANTREALQAAQTQYVEQQALVQELERFVSAQGNNLPEAQPSNESHEAIQQYHTLLDRLSRLRETELALLSKYLKKPDEPATERLEGTRQTRNQSQEAQNPSRRVPFVGNERDLAQTMARERYRRQNDTGFAYNAGKKDFDTLVKEAEQEILGQKNAPALEAKESETQLLKFNQKQVENLEKQRSDFEKRFPGIASSVPSATSQDQQLEISAERTRLAAERSRLATERARLAGLEARQEALKSHLVDLQKQSTKISDLAPQIEQLERTKEIEETNYKYFQASLEKARIDEALDPSKIPNISVVQNPSAAFKASRATKKIILGLAGGGVGVGVTLAFLMELVINQNIRRPRELEALLETPLLVSIPYLNGHNLLRLLWSRASRSSNRLAIAPWDSEHFIRPYSEAIRDRLVLYFELNQMVHKPKLVAVTDCSGRAGASTLAAGLAAALSETGDGKVLLVDMNVGRPEIHPFFRGTPRCSLTEALVGDPSPAGENLYLAVATSPETPKAQLIPKRFYDLVPHLKASDFDYIIFDMPSLGQTSGTLPMSRFMDKVLIVVEAEKSNRDVVKRAYAELVALRASVSVILNKTRSFTPKWLGEG